MLELFDLSWFFSKACRNGCCSICVLGFVIQGFLKIYAYDILLREMTPPRRNTRNR